MSKHNSIKEQIRGSKRLSALKHHRLRPLNFIESHNKNKRRDFYLNLIEQQPAYIKHLSGDELYTEMPKIKSSKYVSPQQASIDLKNAIIYYEKITNPLQQTNMNITSHATPQQTGRMTTSAHVGKRSKKPTKRDLARKQIQKTIKQHNAVNPFYQHKKLVAKESGGPVSKKQQKQMMKARKKSGLGAISSSTQNSLGNDIYRQTMQERINNDVTHNYNPAKTLRKALRFPANMLPHSELKIFADNNLSPKAIEANTWERIIIMFAVFVIFSGAGWVLSRFPFFNFIPHLTVAGPIVGIISAIAIWMVSHSSILSIEQTLKYKRQSAFNEFCEILVPYMTKIKNGDNIIDILSLVARRTTSAPMRERINSLILRIDNNCKARQPYVDFADSCSGSVSSEMFMNIVYDMAQGDFDTEGINNMDRDLNNNQIRQIRNVIKYKMKRFKKVETLMLCNAIFFILAFLIMFIFSIMLRFKDILASGGASGI